MIPRHSAITVQALEEKGYRENRAAKRRFAAPYALFTIPGVFLFFGSIPVAKLVLMPRYPDQPCFALGIATALLGLALVAVPSLLALHAVPTNPKSGRPLDIYEQADTRTRAGYLAFIYVDHDDKTYFVRTVTLDYGGGGS